MKKIKVFFILSLIPTAIFAACPASQKTIFHCTTTQQKHIQVCDANTHIHYKFGKNLNQPELQLSVPRHKTSTNQWGGIGPSESYSVNIPNANTIYSVFSSLDKNTFESTAGVAIYQNDKLQGTVYCNQNSPITEDLFDIDLPAHR